MRLPNRDRLRPPRRRRLPVRRRRGLRGADVAPTPATLGADGRGHRLPAQRGAGGGGASAGRARDGADDRRVRLRPHDGQGGVLRARRAVGTEPARPADGDRLPGRGVGENISWGSGMLNTGGDGQGVDGVRGASDRHPRSRFSPCRDRGRTWCAGCRCAGGGDLRRRLRHRAGGQQLFPGADCRRVAGRSALGRRRAIFDPLRRRAAAQVKRAVRTWMDAGRSGDATAFCRLQDNRMLQAQTGKTNDAGIAACQQASGPTPACRPPPSS